MLMTWFESKTKKKEEKYQQILNVERSITMPGLKRVLGREVG